MTTYLHRLIDYNNWANRGVLEFLRTVPPPVLDETVPGVFGSIRQTLEHLLSSELSYHRNLAGLPRMEGGRPENPSLETLAGIAGEAAANWTALVESLPEPGQMLPLRDGKRAAATVFTQLLVHGIEHRTHVWTILGSLGIRGLELDAWAHGIFAHGDAWPADWGPEPARRASFPTPEQN